ncbi:hypothetical protein FOZ63_032042 [Perkinsus olseni]|uniref:Uncharacterized protein n=1 Tax=Perkinsus olseni TaxID=32597 RepID=A0A7J6QJV7_PEROL|nr:hypothetical protein FOZ62_027993 [Perkinsus olseni]KAF4708502.1 hypothetical protein FOZ63_032042 [Perkinsus olseni]
MRRTNNAADVLQSFLGAYFPIRHHPDMNTFVTNFGFHENSVQPVDRSTSEVLLPLVNAEKYLHPLVLLGAE